MKEKTYIKTYLGLLAVAMMAHILSMFAFAAKTAEFYYRPWEYFDEIAYRTKSIDASWSGEESGDLSRKNLIFFQESNETRVTTDPDGFRSNPIPAEGYPILVSGDSAVFGSGLSDDETFSWRLTEMTGIPTFNAGRTSLFNALKRKELADVKLVIDCRVERNIKGDVFHEYSVGSGASLYMPIAANDLDKIEAILKVTPERYSILYILLRMEKRVRKDLFDYLKNRHQAEWLFMRHTMNENDLEEAVESIGERARILDGAGIEYLFVPIPAKQTIYADEVDEFTLSYLARLVELLEKEDVHTIDLTNSYKNNKEVGLFQRYDTHWNGKGTEVAARAVAKEVEVIFRDHLAEP